MLLTKYSSVVYEAGCDEAGRGCLAGPVFAAAVILPDDFYEPTLTDSKLLSPAKREKLRKIIEKEAISYAVATASVEEIDSINILNASILAMHRALSQLTNLPEFIIIDGNRFKEYKNIEHRCIIKGDSKYASIAAASILAKTYRDDFMRNLSKNYPEYNWDQNKGYPTLEHQVAILKNGITPFHRKTFCNKFLNNQK